MAYNCPKFFELEVNEITVNSTEDTSKILADNNHTTSGANNNYSVVPTDLRVHQLYVNIYLIYMNIIVNGKKQVRVSHKNFDVDDVFCGGGWFFVNKVCILYSAFSI